MNKKIKLYMNKETFLKLCHGRDHETVQWFLKKWDVELIDFFKVYKY